MIPFDDDDGLCLPVTKEINTSPLHQSNLPDLIPPGSIPGTPDQDLVKPDSVAMVITARMEYSDIDRKTSVDKNGNGLITDSTQSSVSTQRTDMSSLRSSTSYDSINSNEALIKKRDSM